MNLLKQSSTAQPLLFLMVDSTDHVTAKTGLTPTVTLSKNGGSFASPSGAVTEIANGWYKVAGNATDTNTLGPLILHATGTAADPVDAVFEVVAFDPQDGVRAGLTALPNAAAEALGGLFTRGTGTGQINQPGDGKIDVSVAQIAGQDVNADIDGNLYVKLIDSAGYGVDVAPALRVTTIAVRTSQTVFTLTAGSADDDAYNGAVCIITDQVTATQKAVGVVLDYTGATKTVTLAFDPGFTSANGDRVCIVPGANIFAASTKLDPTAAQIGVNVVNWKGAAAPAMTGDAFARLGAPTGASISADIAAVKTDTGNLVTRITSTLFSGITSLAQWLGLLAGKQAGNATARTEIRATGAGSGTYDETTDSQEAISDTSGASAADIADAVWDEALAGHATAGSAGAGLSAAQSAGDPWSTALPGAYVAGTAGYIIGTNLDAAVSSNLESIVYSRTAQAADTVSTDADYYVRTDGSDANAGTADTAAGAFSTIAHAMTVAVSGDVVQVGEGFFDQGTTQLVIGAGVILNGSGQGKTIITSELNASTNTACVLPGTECEISNLTIWATLIDGSYQTPLGAITDDAAYTNAYVHDVTIIGDSDGVNNKTGCSVLAENVTFHTKIDAVTAGPGTKTELRDCTLFADGPSATGLTNFACGISGVLGECVAKDCMFVVHQGASGSGAALGVRSTVNTNTKITLIGCTVSTINDAGNAATDLTQSGTALLYVDADTVYSTHSGTITTLPVTLTQHGQTLGGGDTISGTYTGTAPSSCTIATHIDFDNSITLTGFTASAGVWSANLPVAPTAGDYSVKVGTYHAGTVTIDVAATQSTGSLTTYDAQGNIEGSVAVKFRMTAGPGDAGQSFDSGTFTLTSDTDGLLSGPFERGATYVAWRTTGEVTTFTVPDTATFTIDEVLGKDPT